MFYPSIVCIYRTLAPVKSIALDSQEQTLFEVMTKQITPEKVIHITWLSVFITLCWPLPINSDRNKIFCFKILQICSIISACLLFLPMLYFCYVHFDDLVVTSSCVCLTIGVSQNIFQTIVCCVKHVSLQVSFSVCRYLM